jgi:hypothetical protein
MKQREGAEDYYQSAAANIAPDHTSGLIAEGHGAGEEPNAQEKVRVIGPQEFLMVLQEHRFMLRPRHPFVCFIHRRRMRGMLMFVVGCLPGCHHRPPVLVCGASANHEGVSNLCSRYHTSGSALSARIMRGSV